MLRFWVSLVFIIISLSGFAQPLAERGKGSSLGESNYYVTLFSNGSNQIVTSSEFESFISKVEKKRGDFKSEEAFLKHIFVKTHQKILKEYVEYCTFSETLERGNYNCLTGTAIYAILLKHFDIDFKIIETNYHIFIIANTKDGEILFESTDPVNGFVSKPAMLEKRIQGYQENKMTATTEEGKEAYQYAFNIYRPVTMEQLLGLLYYNYAVAAYNEREILTSINYLDKAALVYHSPRLETFSSIILLTVEEGNIDDAQKQICLKKINLIRQKMPLLASKSINR